MNILLKAALDEAAPMRESRSWSHTSEATIQEPERLLDLVAMDSHCRAPTVQVGPDGAVRFEWEAAQHGWIALSVNGTEQLTHTAVIGDDEFEQSEAFNKELPEWAGALLRRPTQIGH